MDVNLNIIDPNILQTFVAIAETGSFAAAARKIGRTEPAVSMQMKRLDDFAGQPSLFIRTGRKTQMTERAEALLVHARKVLSAHAELSAAFKGEKPAGSVRFGVPDDYLDPLLSSALQRFTCRYPRMRLDVACHSSETLSHLMAEKRLDLAVVTKGEMQKEMEIIRREPMVWAASPGYEIGAQPDLPIATFQSGCWGREMALRACDQSGIRHHVAYSSPSLAGILWAVRKGLAVAPLARCSVPPDLVVLQEEEALPALPALAIALMRNTTPLADKNARAVLEEEIRRAMRIGPEKAGGPGAASNAA